ncbi:alanine dehydrogenase [Anaerolineales bacterium]
MIIGIPKEIKVDENRVSLPPHAVSELVKHGHDVRVEDGAGLGSGFSNEDYIATGAQIVKNAEAAWGDADMVVKVKEPQKSEYAFLREDLILFTYLHLAAAEELTHAMLESGVTGIAYETVEDRAGRLPMLEPMSEVAGRMATQVIAHYLEKRPGGRGILMGGVPGVRPANVVVLGGGTVGTQAARVAVGMGANVTIMDVSLERLRYLDDIFRGQLKTLYSNHANIKESISTADAIIGSVLIPGARAPHLITRDMLSLIPERAVIVDVAVDQGGCVESTHPTTHSEPTFLVDDILHYGVANMPGAVPRTSSLALSNATLPYAVKLANYGLGVLDGNAGFLKGLNTYKGQLTYQAVGSAFGIESVSPEQALSSGVVI